MPGFVAISGAKFYVLMNAVVVHLVDSFTMVSIIFCLDADSMCIYDNYHTH